MSNAWEQRLQQANAKASTQSGGSSAWEERLRQAEAASASQVEAAANQAAAQEAETINRIASANPYSVENLGPSPLQSNVQPNARAPRNPYSEILNGLAPQATRETNNTLAGLQVNMHDPIFEEQAQKKQAEQAAKERIASRNTSDFMEGVRTGMKEQPKEQAQPTQSRNLLAVNVDAERSKRENAEKMQDQIKDLQKVVNAYDATGIYDDRYAAYKFTLDEAQKEYDRLYSGVMKDQDIDQAEKLQRLAEIESVQGNSDYWGKTQYDPSLGSVSTYNPVTNTYETTGDLVYDIVNDRNGARGIDAANAAAMGADLAGLDLSRLKQMSADERRVYNYLYNTNGKEQADEYLQLLSSDLNARQMNEVTTWWRDYAAEHPMAASAASVVMSPMRGLSYLGQAGDMAMINKDEEGYYRTGLDQNAGYNRFSRIPSEIRNEVSQNIESKWGTEGSFLYQTGMSMADFITNAALSGNFLGNAPGSAAAAVSEALSLTIMGTGAAADATIAAKERGLDDDQSFALGTIAGVAEILTEKVSMESLLDLTHMDRNMIGYLLKNTLAEGSEEVGSDFINLFADIIVAKDESEWAKSVQEYKDRGMKDDQAFWAAFADQGKQMGMDFLGGAISGLAMASGSVTINQTAQAINNRRFENAIAQLREMDAQTRSLDAQAAADAIAEAQENMQPVTEATMEQDASPANSAPEANAQPDVELAQQLAANGTDPAIISAITGLMPDQEGNWTAAAETQQAVQPAEQITTLQTEQMTTQAAEPADIVNGGFENEVPVSGSSEWNDGARTGGQSGPVAEGTGRTADNAVARARELGAVRAGRYAAATGEVKSTKDLGIQYGIESKTLQEVPYTTDQELENIHALTQAMGVDTVFLNHKMQIRNGGRIQNVTGAYDEASNRIYVCVTDERHTASALTMHEMYHAMQAANRALTETIWNALENDTRFGTEYMNNRLLKTIEAYRGVYGTSEEDLAKYKDEVIADIYGGLNRGKLEVTPDLQNAVIEIADQPQWSTPGEARAAAETADQMDSTVSSIDDEDDLGPTSQAAEEAFVRYSLVTDPDELQFLDNQDGVKVYRAMQVIDGELYPPMAAKVKDESGRLKLVEPTRIGEWYRSDERQDLIKGGKFVLNKGNGTTVPAAYNPYFHTSASPLNDQFSSAYKRPNLVVVECEIPASELTSGYKAPYAKDSVGETKWHAGPVASKLKGEKARRVFLSRWVKVNRIMPDAEVADIIAATLQGESVSVPSNVVTPTLLSELRDRGVKIEDIPGQGAPENTRFSVDEAYEEQVAEVAPQVKYSLAYEENDQHIQDLEKNYSKESAASLEDLKETTRNVTQMWRDIAATVNSSIVNEWNSRQGSDRVFTVFKAQMGYRYNAELSSMCKKGIPLFEAIDSLVQKDVIKRLNTKTLGLEEKKILYELLQERGFEIPCAICFVEQSRQREGVLINNFLNGDDEGKLGWNNVLDDLERRMADAGVIFSFDSMSRDIATDRYNWRDTALPMTDAQQAAFEQALMDACNEELEKFNETAKRPRKLLTSLSPSAIKASLGGSISSNLRIFKVLATEPQSRLRIDPSLLYSSYTTRNLAKSGNHNQLYTLFNSQGGVSGAKSKQRAEVYWGDVLKKKWSPSKVRDETGLRNQSNSDFQMITFLDQAQLYTDLTAKGYYLQAYTKTLTEAKLFGLSNAKINCSLIPAVRIYRNADGTVDVARTMETAGLDENGEPIYDDVEGINHNEYIMLRGIPEYSQSLGGTCIGYSDAHIAKLLDTEYVTQIIGYHDKTNDPKKRYRGATYAKNYNGENEAVDKNGKTVHLSFSEFLRKAEQRFQKNGEDFEGTTTYDGREWTANDIPKLAAQMYKDTCDQKGYSYAYPQFAEHENYYKLLVDFPVYDNQGNYAPHKKVNFQLPAQVPMREADGSISWMDTAEFATENLRSETMVTERIAEEMAETGPDSLTEEFVRRANAEGQMRLSVADETEEELPATQTEEQQTRAQAEAMTQAQLEQRLKTDREQTEKYNLLRTEGVITPELERRAQVHEDATRVREQVLAEKRKGTGDSIDTQVDLTIRVGRKESARNLLRNLEQRKSALSMLPKSQQDAKMMADLNAGIERLKNHLREQNKSARQEIRKQREETARNVRANESRTTLRDELLRSFSVETDRRGQIGQLIDDFATRIQERGRLNRDDRNRLFNELLDSGAVRVIEDDYAAEIRNQLRGTRVYVPQEVRDEWKGDFNEFRKRAWGSGLYLTSNPEDGSWDIHNAELAELYPGAFAEDETDAKVALENMLSAAENGKPVNMSLRDWLKLESGGSEEGTASALRTMMDEMDAALDRFAGAQKIEIDMKARSIMEEAREMLAMQERADRIRENRELSELQKETMNSMRQLYRLRKKTSNATRAQIDAVIGNIDLLARHISPEGLENLQALEREYQARKEELGDNFVPIDYVEERLGRLSKRHVDEMDAAELKELGRVVSGMITSIKNSQQMIGEENARMIADVANDWQDEVSNSKGMNTNLLNRWLKADQARPSTFLQMISGWRDGAGQLLARQLESGELKQLRFMQRASEMFDPFTKENKEWLKKASGKNAEWITINGIDGVDAESNSHVSSISITPMMRVALFMHANNYDNMRHIAEGGIRIPDQKLYQQGKVDDAYNRGKRVVLQPTDLYKILGGSPKTGNLGSNMTDQEKAFAKILKRYMDGLSKEAINETSMELDGFERAMEANYYPIQTDRRYLKTPPDAVKHDISVENTGSIANERQHAANPIELRDATDTLAWHMEQTARYHGMAVPIRNLNAVYKYNFMRQPGEGPRYATSVEDTIGNKWGGDATKYIERLMADLQGGQSAEQSTFGQISAKLRGKLAGATLTLNPSVALSQLASYPAALQQLGAGAMARGLNLANRVDEKLIAAYTPLLWYRSQGNITDELNRDTLKLPKVLDWISDMDTLAIKRLWAASEAWVRMNTDLQKPESPAMDGSDPFYQRVAEKFNRVVWDTQPNYTTMQRTQLQRQGNELTKILAMYKTVPLQYYNMILEAQTRLKETSARAKAEGATDAEKKAYEDAKQFAARTHTGLLASNAFYVFIKTVIMNSLLRKRDDLKDDEGNKTPASIIEGLAWALAEVYAGSIIGSDVLMQAAKHLVKGDRFYGLELSSVSTINDMVEQGMNFGDVLKKVLSGTADLDDGLDHDAAAMTARLMGVPAENIEKWLLVATKWIAPEWANKYENLFDQIEKRDLKAGSSQKDLEAQISVLMENRTDDLQDETIQELARLWAAGYGNAIPTAIQNTATVNGEDITLTAKQKKAYRDAWSDPVSNSLQDLMDTDLYQEADDEQRQKMIATLYDYARGKAKQTALDVEPDSWIKAADESDMNLADYIAERVWLNGMAGNDDQSATEVKMEQLMAADMDDVLRAQTYRNVLASPSEKAALEAVGGTEADQVEAVNTLYKIRTATATDEQTAAEQKRNAILESDLTKEQQAELYYNLLADKDGKAWIDNVIAAGDDKADVVNALMNYQNASGTVEKIQTILDSDLSDEGKLELYHKITKERDDRIETFGKAGLDLDDYLTITQKYSEINAGDESAGEKSTAFAKWLDDQRYTRNQKDTVKDEIGYYSMVRADSEKYDALTEAGLSSQNAQKIYNSVNALEPEDGASQVSEIQKLEAIGNSGLSAAQQLEAAKVYASDSSDRKLDVLDGYSVSVSQWAEFRSLYADYQEQYKGQKGSNQNAAKDAAMDVIGSNISTQAGREAAAALWQTADTGWKAKNNPFDVSTGEQIYNAMH